MVQNLTTCFNIYPKEQGEHLESNEIEVAVPMRARPSKRHLVPGVQVIASESIRRIVSDSEHTNYLLRQDKQ